MNEPAPDLHALVLTTQEARTIYRALDTVIPLLVAAGYTESEITTFIALRERFYVEEHV